MTGILKKNFPSCKIFFLGKKYTKPVIDCCEHVDEFIDWDELSTRSEEEQIKFISSIEAEAIVHVFPNRKIAALAKAAKIPERIGTSHRWFHWFTCNELPNIGRKRSGLHEAQLNIKLLASLNLKTTYGLNEVNSFYGFKNTKQVPPEILDLIDKQRKNVILHPRSRGSAREWGLGNFSRLIEKLPEDKFNIFISGTKEEGEMMKDLIKNNSRVHDLTGKLTLPELIAFIDACDSFVAASTGPLHIAAALGKKTIGLYAPMRPIHPGRWAPVGKKASFLTLDRNCNACRRNNNCKCIKKISASDVASRL